MIIGIRELNGEIEAELFYNVVNMNEFFFSPVYDNKWCIPLKVSGATYQERKIDLENKAIEYSHIMGDLVLSYSELADITDFFETNGRRYGLLTEFRENCIC